MGNAGNRCGLKEEGSLSDQHHDHDRPHVDGRMGNVSLVLR
jgi:hypothetical protein